MASSLVNKRLLIVVFFILCFISFQATARTLKERSNTGMGDETINGGDHKTFKPKANNNEANNNNDGEGEVFSMDYTPAARKPPIHN